MFEGGNIWSLSIAWSIVMQHVGARQKVECCWFGVRLKVRRSAVTCSAVEAGKFAVFAGVTILTVDN